MKNTVVWNDRLASQLPPSSPPLLSPFRPIKLATTTDTSHYPIGKKTQALCRNTTIMHTFVLKRVNTAQAKRFLRYMPSILRWESPSESSAHSVGQ